VKAAAFDYVRADGLDHALDLLHQYGYEAKLLAGGQSLIPMMAMRLARPSVLVDIHGLTELKELDVTAQTVSMGASMRQRTLEYADALTGPLPLIKKALKWVGHSQTRNRGTVGGSLVHADPSAELPLAAVVLGARLYLKSQQNGVRDMDASAFFQGPMFTDIQDTECLISVEWPVWGTRGVGSAFDEVAIRHGDFAMASAAAQIQLDEAGVCRRAAFGLGGVDGTPRSFPELAQRLEGERLDDALLTEISREAAMSCEPGNDLHASADYRRHLATILAGRVLRQAKQLAQSSFRGVGHEH